MANPTTNYGWPMPTATDLVTDLPADFAAFGQPVDTSLKALNPETTLGDIAYRSSTLNTNTRLGIGTNGQVLAVSGGVPAWTTTADVTPLTTKGDVFTFSTVDARIGVGANNTVLTADSAEATGLKWATPSAGGMTLITTTTWNNTVGTYTYSSLGSYKQIVFVGQNLKHDGYAGISEWNIRFNGSTANNYGQSIIQMNGTTYSGTVNSNQANKIILSVPSGSMLGASGGGANFDGDMMLTLPDYGSAQFKGVFWSGGSCQDGTRCISVGNGHFSDTTAISSVTIFMTTGNFESGTMRVYGVS